MGHFVVFLTRQDPWSGKAVSTANLIDGLNAIGKHAISVDCTGLNKLRPYPRASWYAVTCLEDLDLLKSVPVHKRIGWLRQNPVTRPEPYHLPRGCAVWLAASEYVRRSFGALGHAAIVLPDAIKLPSQSLEPESRQGLLFVGRAERSKGLSLLFNMLSHLPSSRDYHLTIVGPSPRTSTKKSQNPLVGLIDLPSLDEPISQVWAMINARRLQGQVDYCDFCSGEELSKHYLSAKFLVAPCPHEPFGMPVVEALAHGCTPLAVRGSGGPDETLAGTPYLVEPTPERFADAVLNRQPLPPGRARKMAEPYSQIAVARKLVKILGG